MYQKIILSLILIFFYLSNCFANEVSHIKNLIIIKEPKKYESITFLDDKNKQLDIKDYHGNLILLNFWASWCAPCRVEHPYLIQLSKEKNIKILGVNFKDKKINALKFLNELGNPYYYMAKDTKGKQSVNFGVYGIPESILINNETIVLKKFIGPLNEQNFNDIKEIINSL